MNPTENIKELQRFTHMVKYPGTLKDEKLITNSDWGFIKISRAKEIAIKLIKKNIDTIGKKKALEYSKFLIDFMVISSEDLK